MRPRKRACNLIFARVAPVAHASRDLKTSVHHITQVVDGSCLPRRVAKDRRYIADGRFVNSRVFVGWLHNQLQAEDTPISDAKHYPFSFSNMNVSSHRRPKIGQVPLGQLCRCRLKRTERVVSPVANSKVTSCQPFVPAGKAADDASG